MMQTRTSARHWIAAMFLSLGACRGGGDTGAPKAPAQTYTVGGTVSGLVGTLMLKNNGGDTLTLTASGNFKFATSIASGAAYSIAISSQPSGPDCAVNGGSGTSTTNVSTVAVVCTVDPETRYLPYQSFPPSLGQDPTGLYVITSKAIERAPVQVADVSNIVLGIVPELTVANNASVERARPAALTYITRYPAGGNHIWSVDLSGSSTLLPRQVGSLTLPLPGSQFIHGSLCAQNMVLKDLQDPRSAFYILRLPAGPAGYCSEIPDRVLLVRTTDGPTTAPVDLPGWVSELPESVGGNVEPIYHANGTLAGLVTLVFEGGSKSLRFYRDETFTLLVSQLDDVQRAIPVNEHETTMWSTQQGSQTSRVFNVTYNDNTEAMVRVDDTGAISQPLRPRGIQSDQAVRVGNELFVSELDRSATPWIQSFYRVSIDGGTASQLLYSASLASGWNRYIIEDVDSDTVLLSATKVIGGSGTNLAPVHLAVMSRLTPGTPSLVAQFDASPTPAGLYLAQGNLVITVADITMRDGMSSFAYSSEIRRADGTFVQPRTPRTSFASLTEGPNGTAIQVRDVTAEQGLGGGALYRLSLQGATLSAPVRLDGPGSNAFTLPTDTVSVALYSATPTTGLGNYAQGQGSTQLAVDLPRNLVISVTVAGQRMQFLRSALFRP